MNDAGAVLLQGDPLNLEPVDAEQECRPALHALVGAMTLRTLNQARDLTFVTMNCLDNSHDHRGHGPYRTTKDRRPQGTWRLLPPRRRQARATIVVSRADGTTTTFVVDKVASYPKDQFPTEEVCRGDFTQSEIRLVTCEGTFDKVKHYLDNVVVFGHLVSVA